MNRVRTTVLFLAAWVVVTMGPGGCAHTLPVGYIAITGDASTLSDLPIAVDVQNHRGSVRIRVDPDAKQPTVIAVAVGEYGMATRAGWAAASLTLDEGHPVLRVLSTPVGEDGSDSPVDIRITVPSCGGIRVVNNDGLVMLKDVRGAIEVQTSLPANDGDAIVLETRCALTDPVLLVADMGNIRVNMGTESRGSLIGSTPSGTVMVDANDAVVRNAKYEKRVWTGIINGGTSEFRITANSGDLMVRVGW